MEFDIEIMCDVFEVSKSGFYSWRSRDTDAKDQSVYELKRRIEDVFKGSRGTYGSPRVFQVLKGLGIKTSEDTVARTMRQMGLAAVAKRRFRVKTTDSNHSNPIAPNLIAQNFDIEIPGTVWLSDITYVETGEGWLYVFSILDLCTRKLVGWSFSDTLGHEALLSALKMATNRQSLNPGLIFHSDRGVQYACEAIRKKLVELGFRQSMSAKGNCYDNAPMESFFHTLKVEMVYRTTFMTKDAARQAIFEWIEVFYNRERIHSSIGFKTPIAYEEALMIARAS